MATKTFKIGLSDTDKQNMAQDVYERLLALTFPEYDTTTEYDVGDFVVYNDQLYKCIGATSGAWDSTKWQLATLNDLLTDIEDAVQFVNDKANVDGNYPTFTAGLADNLTPYSEDSGAEQENPFISNGTGTNNNTEIVTVGDYGLLKEKQGHTLVVNQLVPNNEKSGSVTPSGTTSYSLKQIDVSFSANKTYIVIVKLTNAESRQLRAYCVVEPTIYGSPSIDVPANSSKLCIWKITPTQDVSNIRFGFSDILASQNLTQTWSYSELSICNLSQMFNGDIPQDLLDNPSHFSWYYNGDLSYNAGSLANANGVRLVSTGRNLWDEEWELGKISTGSGQNVSDNTAIRSKNYITVPPNKTIYFKADVANNTPRVLFYDINKNFIIGYGLISNTFTTPSNACYMRFWMDSSYGTTYKDDITISLYYTPEEGGEGYDQYYPYEEPYVVDTGNEPLLAFDTKDPDGTIHHNTDKKLDLSSLNFGYNSTYQYFYCNISSLGIKSSSLSDYAKLICNKYVYGGYMGDAPMANVPNKSIYTDGSYIKIKDTGYSDATTFKAALTDCEIQFELETPTTEQGTTFAKNLPINDYGMLYWLDSSNNLVGIPQGAKIFYPVNYKGFIDDLYSKIGGNTDDYALNSELNAKFETYLKSLNGYDASATQVLKNVEGTLTWVTEGE